eukprot:3607972-Amphidinium_carterae.1
MESIMWEFVVSPHCAPVVMQQLREGELTADYNRNGHDILKTFAALANTATLPMTTTAAISQSTCLRGRRQSTQSWRT